MFDGKLKKLAPQLVAYADFDNTGYAATLINHDNVLYLKLDKVTDFFPSLDSIHSQYLRLTKEKRDDYYAYHTSIINFRLWAVAQFEKPTPATKPATKPTVKNTPRARPRKS